MFKQKYLRGPKCCFWVALIAFSCRGIAEADKLDLSATPIQVVENMFAVQTKNGVLEMRLEAPLMNRYKTDEETREIFPKGIAVYAYTEEGLLESIIIANEARHIVPTGNDAEELWEAYGNVILHNVIKRETMQTDTLYWDQANKEVYTHRYVRMYSPDGFTQGIGMRSDDHVRNARLYNPFDSYVLTVQDTTAVIIDSVNFIGPFPKK